MEKQEKKKSRENSPKKQRRKPKISQEEETKLKLPYNVSILSILYLMFQLHYMND